MPFHRCHRTSGRSALLGLALSVCALFVGSSEAHAGLTVALDEAEIFATREDTGGGQEWFFSVELNGVGITSAMLQPPSGPLIELDSVSMDGREFDFSSVGFASFASLQLTYPAGDYLLTLNLSETATLAWDPPALTGATDEASVSITSPPPGSDIFDREPDIGYTLDCTNCKDIEVEMGDIATGGMVADFEGSQLDTTPPPNPFPFSSLSNEDGDALLPAGEIEVELRVGHATFHPMELSPSMAGFDYIEGAAVYAESDFVVHFVEEVLMEALKEDRGAGASWYFVVEIDGGGLGPSFLDPPSGPLIGLAEQPGGEDLLFESAPFASFAALQSSYPAGDYDLTINNSQTATLNWNPSEPTGTSGEPAFSITSPVEGSADNSSMPDIAYTMDCSNCKDLDLDLEGGAGETFANFGFGVLDTMPLPNPILFDDMEFETEATELPNGSAEVEMIVGLADFSTLGLAPSGQQFQYVEVALLLDTVAFIVPQPGAAHLGAAALLTLFALRRRHR